jgi:hypothetical protein
MALDWFQLCTWATALTEASGFAVPFEIGPDILEYANADVAGTITPLPGFGTKRDGTFDQPQWQVRVRASEHQLAELIGVTNLIDKAIVQDVGGQLIWGTWVVLTGRSGGSPSPLAEATRERRSFVCTYFAEVEL